MRSTGILCTKDPASTVLKTFPCVINEKNTDYLAGPAWPHSHTLDLASDGAHINLKDFGPFKLDSVTISGLLQWRKRVIEPEFKILERVDDQSIFAGAALADCGVDDGRMFAMIFPAEGRDYPCPTSDAGHLISAALRCRPWMFNTRSGTSFSGLNRCIMSPRSWMRATLRIARHLPNVCVLISASWMAGGSPKSPPACRPFGPWNDPVRSGFRAGEHLVEPVSGGAGRRRWRRPGTFRGRLVRFRVWR